MTEGPVLVADDVSVERGGLPVLRGVSLQVAAGEVVALLGGNGSGKSTLVRALLGLLPLGRGSVTLFGDPVGRFRGWSRVGYVPQRSTVNLSRAKVAEVVASGRLSRRPPFVPRGRGDRAAVARALEVVGLEDRGADHLSELSGGQQQRVLIARALAGTPELLVLDEPNAGVDLAHQQVLAQILGRLVATGTAVVVVLHEVGPLAGLVDRAVVLREGRVAYDGPLDALTHRHDHHHDAAEDPHGDADPRGVLDEPRLA